MTKNPVAVRADALAVEALKISTNATSTI